MGGVERNPGDIEAEKLVMDQQVRLAERLDLVMRVASHLSHEFNNQLLVVRNCLDFIRADKTLPSAVIGDLEQLSMAASRMESLARRMQDIGRRSTVEPRSTSLNLCLSEVVEILKRIAGSGVQLIVELDPAFPEVRLDVAQMHQALLALILQSAEASLGVGKLTLSSKVIEITEEHPERGVVPQAGTYALVSVADDGEWMDLERLASVIDPLYASRVDMKGLDIGLSLVHRFARRHAGGFVFQRQADRGSIYKVFLPVCASGLVMNGAPPRVAASNSVAVREVVTSSSVRGEKPSVLVVDDEDSVRAIVVRMLVEGGCEVRETASGAEVIPMLRKHPVDVVITDIVMPDKEGIEICREIRKEFPGKKIIAMSGARGGATYLTIAEKLGADLTLAKPFSGQDLLAALRAVLGSKEKS
jgi:two-component system cell cycle sensor histidine kinase/response regulator CckA